MTSIRVLGIAGSPRWHGNTETLLDRFLAGAESVGAATEKVMAAWVRVGGCIACACGWGEGGGVVQDDFKAGE